MSWKAYKRRQAGKDMFYGNLMHVVTLQELISTENVFIYIYVNANMEW